MIELIWLIPLIPLLGFIINGLGQYKLSKFIIGLIGCGAVLISFILSCLMFSQVQQSRALGEQASTVYQLFEWISVGSLNLKFSFLLDPLSSLMLLVVTGVGFLIHLYSYSYMHLDAAFGRFFAYLNLFIFFMLLLVLGSNYLIMFIGWEGVGLCSYLLIGFWYKNSSYASAAKKAFVMNRIGDLGFLIAVFAIISVFGSLEYTEVFDKASTFALGDSSLLLITLLLFVAATGKSAQIPLFTWLPDAMAGPTPVSALIHAATMVTAGIYMIIRSNILFTLSPITLQIIAGIGVATALIAAFIALTQNDIKKVLAYSTVSQLGYMFLALGVGAYTAAFFHVLTHAFFKALLFLGAGSVIHAMHDEQDMRAMGGLKKKLPITYITMFIATIAISGIPPLSGFFSKDEILAQTFISSPLLWAMGLLAAFFTAFYMFRMLFLTFFGKFRGSDEQREKLHESPYAMTIPLIVLAIFSALGGLINVPSALGGGQWLTNFLRPIFAYSDAVVQSDIHLEHSTEYILMAVSAIAALVMAFFAYNKYVSKGQVPQQDGEQSSLLYRLSYHKLYIDELYDSLFVKPLNQLAKFLYKVVDKSIIDGLVNSLAYLTETCGRAIRQLQSGYIGFYFIMMVLGVAAILLYGFFNI